MAAENRRNLVIDGTMRSPESIRDLAHRLKDAGYKVEARVMAVNAKISFARARLRGPSTKICKNAATGRKRPRLFRSWSRSVRETGPTTSAAIKYRRWRKSTPWPVNARAMPTTWPIPYACSRTGRPWAAMKGH
ncbi:MULTISPECIES: zeta toxin family protein [Mycetohabitans]|uniref:zeta toxin family protein n=1 Tax=Mycetohabitans TaxID=2571159 RepID=UPI002FCDF4A9